MFRKLMLLSLFVITSCSGNENSKIVNDKLFNGYSYPVEGGITSTYVNDDINVIFVYNIKSSNLFSICSGEVESINNTQIEISCTTGEKVVYFDVIDFSVEETTKVQAGEKIGDLEMVGSRYKVNIEFYQDQKDLSKSLTDIEFIDYLNIGRADYEKK